MSMTMRRKENPTVGLLRGLAPFRGHDDRALAKLAQMVDVVELDAGHVLTLEGRSGRETFLVVEGSAEVAVHGSTIATIGPGQLIGEMAMLEREPRTATVTAKTPMTVLVVGAQSFETFCSEPAVSRLMATGLSERLRKLES